MNAIRYVRRGEWRSCEMRRVLGGAGCVLLGGAKPRARVVWKGASLRPNSWT